MVMSQVCDLRMRMNEKKKIGIEYEMAYVYNVYVSLQPRMCFCVKEAKLPSSNSCYG